MLRRHQGPGRGGLLEVLPDLQLDHRQGGARHAAGHDFRSSVRLQEGEWAQPGVSNQGEEEPVCRQSCEELALRNRASPCQSAQCFAGSVQSSVVGKGTSATTGLCVSHSSKCHRGKRSGG